jgi:O-antigen ligase
LKIMTLDRAKEHITRIYIYVMLGLYPLFTGFRGYGDITAAKLAFFLAVTLVWAAGLVLLSIRDKDYFPGKVGAVDIILLIYVLFCCISAALSPFRGSVLLGAGRFDGLAGTALGVLIFFGVSRYAKPERGYVYALAVGVLGCCVVAVGQFMGGNPLRLFPGDFTYYGKGIQYSGEFLGTIGNANLFSAYLALALPVVLGGCLVGIRGWLVGDWESDLGAGFEGKRRWDWMFLLPVFLLGAYCLFRCTVSAGKLGLLCALALGPLFVLKTKKARLLFLGALGGAAAIGLILIYNFPPGEGTLFELSRVLHGEFHDSFGSSRIRIWRDCLELVRQRPLFGGGSGTATLRLDIDFSRFVPETGKTLTASVDNAHNVYLGILTDTGAFALLAYLAAIGFTVWDGMKRGGAEGQDPRGGAGTILIIGLIAYWVQDFFGLGLFIVSPLMWVIWGLSESGATAPQ